jgi:hypothetical protein
MTTDPRRMKVKELKEALRAKGLPVTGLKAALLARLLAAGASKPTTVASSAPYGGHEYAASMNANRKRLQQLQRRQVRC